MSFLFSLPFSNFLKELLKNFKYLVHLRDVFRVLFEIFRDNRLIQQNTGYFRSNNESGGIENATHNTFTDESRMVSLPIILFVTTDIYEKVKIRRLKCNKSASAVACLCRQ
jgi:hypothetical protein